MKAIQLNHSAHANKNALLALLLLITGLLMLAGSIFYFKHVSGQTQRLAATVEQLTHPKKSRSSLKVNSREYIKVRDEVAAVNVAIAEIVMPWTSIFKTLEATDRPDVKLISIEPDIKKKALRINAVAMDIDSMMRYIDDLSQQNMLKSVALVTQQSADINGQPAIDFVLEALW